MWISEISNFLKILILLLMYNNNLKQDFPKNTYYFSSVYLNTINNILFFRLDISDVGGL